MDTLPVAARPRTCGTCRYWTPGWVGPESWGFCTWKEDKSRPTPPRMNVGSQYTLSAKGDVLETRSDAACIQWENDR